MSVAGSVPASVEIVPEAVPPPLGLGSVGPVGAGVGCLGFGL